MRSVTVLRRGVFCVLARTLLNQAVRRVIHGTLSGRLAFITSDSMTARVANATGQKFKGHLRGAHSRDKLRVTRATAQSKRRESKSYPNLEMDSSQPLRQ